MKRTTIFLSRLAQHRLMVGLVVAGLAVPLAGATVLPAQQPAASGAPARAPLPATHVVQRGETLWGLAQQFLGDPLLWPEIYRLNTAVIEDPHWIFPGEELHLGPGGEAVAAAPTPAPAAPESAAVGGAGGADTTPAQAPRGDIAVTPAPAESAAAAAPESQVANPATGTTIFASQGRTSVAASALKLNDQREYRAVREGEYYSAGWVLDAGEQLNAGTLIGNVATSSISRLTTTNAVMLYGTVAVTPPPGDSLKVGDLLLSYDLPRVVQGYGSIVRPTGLLKVIGYGGRDTALTHVVALYQQVDGGQYVVKAVPFESRRGVRAAAVSSDSAVRGEVLDLRSPREVVNEQGVLFINKGSTDGVHQGDIFQVSRTSPPSAGIGALTQNQGKILIVLARPHSATGVLIQVDRGDIRPGSDVVQIRRMPS
ncbi:MAG TPA: LysM domain-containing protein [Gemmatimonadales bacterium]|nr:LysM domain-containing protein [Gemmatimonadales bacterium]